MNHCVACKWHAPAGVTEQGVAFGHCHRYPPVSLTENQSTLAPVDSKNGWCGEFVKAPRKAASR
jgi:hypothetical protein